MAIVNVWIMKVIEPIILPKIKIAKRNTICFVVTLLLILWSHTFEMYTIKINVTDFIMCGTSVCKKGVSMVVFLHTCIFCMWYALVFKRKAVVELLKEYHAFHRSYRIFLRKSGLFINAVTIIYILICIGNVVAFMGILGTDDDLTNLWYSYLDLFPADISVKRTVLFIYFLFSRTFFMFFPCILSLFHITLFVSLCHALKLCEIYAASICARKDIDIFMKMYTGIHRFSSTVESAISLEMFFMSCYQYSISYQIISTLYDSRNSIDTIMKIQVYLLYLQVLLFAATVFAASEVQNRDISLKVKIRGLIFELSLSTENLKSADFLSRFLDSKPTITFSAWKMFSFTRTFFITSIGVILTYSILILQVSAPGSKD